MPASPPRWAPPRIGGALIAFRDTGLGRGDLGGYQMNAYADSYHCNRLALVYPATAEFPSGHVTSFVLLTATRPVLEVLTIDVHDLAFGSGCRPALMRCCQAR